MSVFHTGIVVQNRRNRPKSRGIPPQPRNNGPSGDPGIAVIEKDQTLPLMTLMTLIEKAFFDQCYQRLSAVRFGCFR